MQMLRVSKTGIPIRENVTLMRVFLWVQKMSNEVGFSL